MTSLLNPWLAMSSILARTTSRYGDVYWRERLISSRRSWPVSSIVNGLNLGMITLLLVIMPEVYVIVFTNWTTKLAHGRSFAHLAFRIADQHSLSSSRAFSRRCRRGDAGARRSPAAASQRLRAARCRRRTGCRQGIGGALAQRRAAVAIRRSPNDDQGHHPRQRLADALRISRHG